MSNEYVIEATESAVTISSMKKIVLKVGDNSITLDSSGITIQAANINQTAHLQYHLKCLEAKTEATAGYKLQSAMVDVAAS